MALVVALGLPLIAVGCGLPQPIVSPRDSPASEPSASLVTAVKLTSTGTSGTVTNMALLEGTLRADRTTGCVWVEYVPGSGANVYWPEGSWAFFEPAPGVIQDRDGIEVARIDEWAVLIGGRTDPGRRPIPAGCPALNDLWVVGAFGRPEPTPGQ